MSSANDGARDHERERERESKRLNFHNVSSLRTVQIRNVEKDSTTPTLIHSHRLLDLFNRRLFRRARRRRNWTTERQTTTGISLSFFFFLHEALSNHWKKPVGEPLCAFLLRSAHSHAEWYTAGSRKTCQLPGAQDLSNVRACFTHTHIHGHKIFHLGDDREFMDCERTTERKKNTNEPWGRAK